MPMFAPWDGTSSTWARAAFGPGRPRIENAVQDP